MNEIYKMLEKYRIVTLQSIHTMIPGVIISYNPIKMEASVLPLGRPVIKGKELEPQPIDRCPVCFSNGSTFSIRNPLKKRRFSYYRFFRSKFRKNTYYKTTRIYYEIS